MHSRLAELLEYTDSQRAVLLEAVAAVPEQYRDRRPCSDAWSVAEVLEHLHMVEQGITRLISRKLDKARAAGLGPETKTESLLQSLDRFALLDRSNRMAAPDIVQPQGSMTAATAAAALEQSRKAFREVVAAGDGLALGTVSASHVLLGPLTLYEWVLFVGQHELRHAMQIRGIREQVGAGEAR
jgi:uncharacterized damage-inducible protein DinB